MDDVVSRSFIMCSILFYMTTIPLALMLERLFKGGQTALHFTPLLQEIRIARVSASRNFMRIGCIQ